LFRLLKFARLCRRKCLPAGDTIEYRPFCQHKGYSNPGSSLLLAARLAPRVSFHFTSFALFMGLRLIEHENGKYGLKARCVGDLTGSAVPPTNDHVRWLQGLDCLNNCMQCITDTAIPVPARCPAARRFGTCLVLSQCPSAFAFGSSRDVVADAALMWRLAQHLS